MAGEETVGVPPVIAAGATRATRKLRGVKVITLVGSCPGEA